MVLDESALEAMLARQRAAERSHEQAPAVRTVKTDEFEVYERRAADPPGQASHPDPARHAAAVRQDPPPGRPEGAAGSAGISHPPQADLPHAAPRHEAGSPADHDDGSAATDFEELPGRQAAGADVDGAGRAHAAPAADATARHAAQATDTQAHSSTADVQARPSAPRRPQVWPPIRPAPVQMQEAAPSADRASPSHGPAAAPASDDHGRPAHQAGAHSDADPASPPPARPRSHAPDAPSVPHAADGDGCRIAIVQAMFNQEITDRMADQAKARAEAAGARTTLHQVPGVFDLPLTVQHLARRKDVDAIVVLGCVVQGETKHDELITFTTAKTLQDISLATDTPIGLGIIGPRMTWEQAQARIGNAAHAVDAAVAMWRATLPT